MDWDNTTKQRKRKDAFIFYESVLAPTMSCAKMLMSRSVNELLEWRAEIMEYLDRRNEEFY